MKKLRYEVSFKKKLNLNNSLKNAVFERIF